MTKEATPESLKVSAELEKEFAEAIKYQLTDDDIERAKLLLGIMLASGGRELFSEATPDAIRNWALGVGDDNPLYTDEEYGPTTRWGSQIGHGAMVGHIKTPMLGDPMPEEIKKGTKSLFRGVHVFVSGGTWDWYRPIYPGDRIFAYHGEESLEVKQSEFAGRSVIAVSRNVCINQRGEVVGVYRVLRVMTERKAAREKGKYAELAPAKYSDEDYAKIDAIYEAEAPRGATPRYWEDVKVGDKLQPMVKGPLTVTEIIAFHAGGYGFVPYGLRASRVGYKNRKRAGTNAVCAVPAASASHRSISRTRTACGTWRNACTGIRSGQKQSATRWLMTTEYFARHGSITWFLTGQVMMRLSSALRTQSESSTTWAMFSTWKAK